METQQWGSDLSSVWREGVSLPSRRGAGRKIQSRRGVFPPSFAADSGTAGGGDGGVRWRRLVWLLKGDLCSTDWPRSTPASATKKALWFLPPHLWGSVTDLFFVSVASCRAAQMTTRLLQTIRDRLRVSVRRMTEG